MDISRFAELCESEACNVFAGRPSPRSPLIVPGAASSGSVLPAICRRRLTAFSLLRIRATDGPDVIKLISLS